MPDVAGRRSLMKLPFNRFTLLAAAWFAAGIYALIFKESGSEPPPFPHFDKVGHFGLFFGQIWLASKIYLSEHKTPPYRALILFALSAAICSELAQSLFTRTREGSFLDAAADMAGALAALWFAHKIRTAGQLSSSSRPHTDK